MANPGWAGRIIDGRYVVESVIGAGGMGLVLKARHKFTGADVALKVLKPELELDTEVQMRFLAEARAPNAIGHPGIVAVVDAGKAPDGLLYLVMELLLGKPLRIPLARGELGAPDMRRILLELLEVLPAVLSGLGDSLTGGGDLLSGSGDVTTGVGNMLSGSAEIGTGSGAALTGSGDALTGSADLAGQASGFGQILGFLGL